MDIANNITASVLLNPDQLVATATIDNEVSSVVVDIINAVGFEASLSPAGGPLRVAFPALSSHPPLITSTGLDMQNNAATTEEDPSLITSAG